MLFAILVDFSPLLSARFNSFMIYAWIFAIIRVPRPNASMPNAATREVKCSHLLASVFFKNHRFQLSLCLFGFWSLRFFLLDFHSSETQVIRHVHHHLVIVIDFWLHFQLCADTGQLQSQHTLCNTSMCSECSFRPLMASEMSDHTAGNSDRSGLRLLGSTSRLGADMITSYIPSEWSGIIADTRFNPSRRCAYPGIAQTLA